MSLAIETTGLGKTYLPSGSRFRLRRAPEERIAAVTNVSLSIPSGEFFGLLGPNGAGKTTLAKMLCTLILPDTGSGRIAGIDLAHDRSIRAVTGLVVSDERSFYWRLTVKQNLTFFAALYGLSGQAAANRVEELLEQVQLADRAGQRYSDLSSGLRQRMAIARALLHRPQILFLDEPTRSLDPAATDRLHGLLRELQGNAMLTIMLITHDLAEAEKLCDRVALMHEGQIRATGIPKTLREQLNPRRSYLITVETVTPAISEQLRLVTGSTSLSVTHDEYGRRILSFSAGEHEDVLHRVLEVLSRNGVKVVSVEGSPPSLEEVFAHYTAESKQ